MGTLSEHLAEEIEKQIKRCGGDFDAVGPVESICAEPDENGSIRVYDDAASEYVDGQKFLDALCSLPSSNIGWEAIWDKVMECKIYSDR